jgi:transposase
MKKRKNHSPEFKAKVALEAIREEMTLAELSKSAPVNATGPNEPANGVHPTQIGTWKRAAIENMATAFTRRGAAPEQVSAADVDKLHSKIGQLVVERDFLAEASHQLLGTRGKKW